MSGKWIVVPIYSPDTHLVVAWRLKRERGAPEWASFDESFLSRERAKQEATRRNNAEEYNSTKTEAKP